LTISSNPINLLLDVGGEKKFDLNLDSYYDLYVKLNYINATTKKADLTIKAINESINNQGFEKERVDTNVTGSKHILSGQATDNGENYSWFLDNWYYLVLVLGVCFLVLYLGLKTIHPERKRRR